MRRLMAILLLAAASGLGGCAAALFPVVALAPDPTRKAEFAGLKDKTVAVVVYADPATLFEYPYVRLELAGAIGSELTRNVKVRKPVDSRRVVRYQDENLHWESMPMPEIAQALQADYVVYVVLMEFTTREQGSINLARGRISAQVSVWDASPGPGADPCAWRKDSLAVAYPPDRPLGVLAGSDRELRVHTERLFADLLAKNFYDHKVPRE